MCMQDGSDPRPRQGEEVKAKLMGLRDGKEKVPSMEEEKGKIR